MNRGSASVQRCSGARAAGVLRKIPLNPSPIERGSGFPLPSGRGARDEGITLNGLTVAVIHADLTAGGGLNLTLDQSLKENIRTSFQGSQ
jgi:hypothetical protein